MARSDVPSVPEPVRSVSEAEREAVLAFLRRLAEIDQLSLDQFSDLADTVLQARNYDELTRMLAVLPSPFPRTPPDQRSRKPLVVRARTAKQEMTGSWHVPRKIVVKVNTGKVSLDFTKAVFDEQQVELDLKVNTGVIDVIVPVGMGVRIVEAVGVRNQLGDAPALPGAPMLHVRSRVRTGVVKLRRPQSGSSTTQRRHWWSRR